MKAVEVDRVGAGIGEVSINGIDKLSQETMVELRAE